jgi:hypothetical protein
MLNIFDKSKRIVGNIQHYCGQFKIRRQGGQKCRYYWNGKILGRISRNHHRFLVTRMLTRTLRLLHVGQRHMHGIYVILQQGTVASHRHAAKAGGKLIGLLLCTAYHGHQLQLRHLLNSRYYRAASYVGTAHNANSDHLCLHENMVCQLEITGINF